MIEAIFRLWHQDKASSPRLEREEIEPALEVIAAPRKDEKHESSFIPVDVGDYA